MTELISRATLTSLETVIGPDAVIAALDYLQADCISASNGLSEAYPSGEATFTFSADHCKLRH